MKIKTSELTGAALDWVVAKCEGYKNISDVHPDGGVRVISGQRFSPAGCWADGGPIIERECINVVFKDCIYPDEYRCFATSDQDYRDPNTGEYGPTPLIAGLRCYVASKLGNEVDVPEGLL